MADLIIKPSAGPGNKLILQDQAGTAIITTSDSGAVMANTSVAGTDLTGDSLGVTAANDTAATLFIKADNSDDAGDDWTVVSNTNQTLTIENDIASAGTGVAMLTITPHATAASSAVAVAGGLTVAGTTGLTGNSTIGGTLGVTGDITIDANQWIRVGGQYALSGDGSGNTFLDNGGGYLSFRKVGTELMKLDSSGLIIGVGVVEKIGNSTATGTTVTVDLETGNFFEIDLQSGISGAITTFTTSNTNQTTGQVSNFILKVTCSASYDFNWGGLTAFKWPAATAPTLTATNGAIDILSFTTYNKGVTWYGQLVGQEFS